ncbi:hypothetical protein NESM_000588200 [Novymonas esmeraldas]|uniref:Uncharacterized protein n=1 Tax=Novymonas esmeraldas TaxID=1808958 RepID=A0AAW0ESK8_9TRYP
MTDATPFVTALLAAKKHEATELFGPWDAEDEGRIAVAQLRPLLLSVLPLPSAEARRGRGGPAAVAAAELLSTAHVKQVYSAVTRRAWTPPAVPPHPRLPSASASAGPTLSEVHAIIDVLCRDTAATVAPPRCSASDDDGDDVSGGGEDDASTWLVRTRPPPSSSTADAPRRRTGTRSPRVDVLYGSIEAVYRIFCSAAVAAGEAVPTALPIDAAHLQRMAVNVRGQGLGLGESHELHRLLLSATVGDAAACLTLDDFVELLCGI